MSSRQKNGRRQLWRVRCLSAVLMVLSGVLGGCAVSGKVVTDVGTDISNVPDRSRYLDLTVLEQNGDEDTWHGFETFTLEYGTFYTNVVSVKANVRMLETRVVKAEFSTGTMYLVEQPVSRNEYVEKGDVIARVMMETNELDLQEQEMKLQRVRERYDQAKVDREKAIEKAQIQLDYYIYDADERQIALIRNRQAALDFERTCASYEKQIRAYEETIKELRETAQITEITAPADGFVLEVNRKTPGQTLDNGTVLARIAPADKICLEFADNLKHYGYGMELTMLAGESKTARQYPSSVININGKSLLTGWDTDSSQLIGDFALQQLMGKGPFYISGVTNKVENVLVLPANAVESEKDKYYVTVLHEDGTLEKRQFLPGGSNANSYWVLEGLDEGTVVCLH